jgi:hypothetical protein
MTCKDKELFQSYLKSKYLQFLINNETSYNNTISSWTLIKNGVPQGSPLCPKLFLLHTNDLPQIVNEKAVPVLFADDTSLLFICCDTTEFYANINAVSENIFT